MPRRQRYMVCDDFLYPSGKYEITVFDTFGYYEDAKEFCDRLKAEHVKAVIRPFTYFTPVGEEVEESNS